MAGMSALSWLGIGLGGALTSLIGYANLPVTWLLPLQGKVPLNHLKTAQLQPLLGKAPRMFFNLFYGRILFLLQTPKL